MGAGASSLGFSSPGGYHFGEVAKESNHSSGDKGNNHRSTSSTSWVGKTLEMPPKPLSLGNYFQFHTVVGTGMLGKVRLIQHRKTKKYYALKSLKKKDVLARKMLAQLESEREAMMHLTKLKHPFLVRYFGSLQTTCHVHLLMEYVPGVYATELVLFIEFRHANGYMYRNLKPENILLDGNGHIKVIDLGFIKKITSEDDRTSTCVGTPQYLAPEQLTNSLEKRSYSKSVDWWALACVIYEMVNGQTPFVRSKDDSSFELYTRILAESDASISRGFAQEDAGSRCVQAPERRGRDQAAHVVRARGLARRRALRDPAAACSGALQRRRSLEFRRVSELA
ncbi:Agc/pka protein kinase, partial [Globisporangium splendens]